MNDYFQTVKLLGKKYFNQYIFTNFIILIGSFLELISLGLIIPLFYFLGDMEANILKINNFFNSQIIPEDTSRTFLIIISVFLFLLFYLIKSLSLIQIFMATKRFINKYEQILSEKVYSNYIYSDYFKSITKKESIKFRNIHEVQAYSVCLQSVFIINQEILTALFILSTILIIDLSIGISILILGFILILSFNFFTKKKLTRLGENRRELESKNFSNIIDALNSIKEIKIFQKESFFLKEFGKIKKTTLENNFKDSIFSFYPKIIIELLVLSFLIIYFVTIFVGTSLEELNLMLPNLVFLVVAAFRILPSINRIILNIQILKKNSASIVNINKEKLELKYPETIIEEENISFNKEINFKDVFFSYDNENDILKNVNLKIKKGEIIGIFGASGSGKTTFINLILGLLKPSKGKIIIDNKKELFQNSQNWQKLLSFVPQKIFMQNTSITRNIAFAQDENLISESKINEAIKISNLSNFVKDKKKSDQIFIGDNAIKISGGQAQRIGIARSYYKNPEILVLDEATNNLDEKNENEIILNLKNYFNKYNRTIVISSHNLDMLKKNCNQIFIFNKQKIEELKYDFI